jgi:hypothetical protein
MRTADLPFSSSPRNLMRRNSEITKRGDSRDGRNCSRAKSPPSTALENIYPCSRMKFSSRVAIFGSVSNLRGLQFLSEVAWYLGTACSSNPRAKCDDGEFLSYYHRHSVLLRCVSETPILLRSLLINLTTSIILIAFTVFFSFYLPLRINTTK